MITLPGKAMGGMLAWLKTQGQLPQEELLLVEGFHAAVVERLKSGDTGASPDLLAQLPELRAVAAGKEASE